MLLIMAPRLGEAPAPWRHPRASTAPMVSAARRGFLARDHALVRPNGCQRVERGHTRLCLPSHWSAERLKAGDAPQHVEGIDRVGDAVQLDVGLAAGEAGDDLKHQEGVEGGDLAVTVDIAVEPGG